MFVPKDYSWDSEEEWPSQSISGLVFQKWFSGGMKAGGFVESGDQSLMDFKDFRKES